jgi:hypothetical protein
MITRPITTIAAEALYGSTCPLADKRYKGAEITTIFQFISTILAVIGCWRTERRYKCNPAMHQQKALAKPLVFKTVVILEAIQNLVFVSLGSHEMYFPTPPYKLSWNDFAKEPHGRS